MLTATELVRNSLKRAGYRARSSAKTPVQFNDLYILDKQQQIRRLELNRVQQYLLDNLTGRDLIVKARQFGVSTAIQAYLFCEAVNHTARVSVMAHDDKATQKLRDMQQLFFDRLSLELQPARSINNATRVQYPATYSAVYIGTAGNTSDGRAGTYSHFHGSEAAFWRNGDQLIAGVLQGVPLDGKVFMESTTNGAQGWFYNEVMAAQRGDSVFTVHFFPWWMGDDYRIPLNEGETIVYTPEEKALVDKHQLTPEQINWRRYKIRELKHLFPQEYPESIETAFLSSGSSVFGEFARSAPVQTEPITGHRYTAGLDWGQADDWTALSIMDATDNREVCLERWRRRSWLDMRREIIDLCVHWKVSHVEAEQNSASSNVENLVDEIAERKLKISVRAFTMTNKTKGEMVSNLVNGLNRDGLVLLDYAFATAEMQQWITQQTASGLWTYTHPEGGHDDTIVARLAAWKAACFNPELTVSENPFYG